jgi:hypothetical protein
MRADLPIVELMEDNAGRLSSSAQQVAALSGDVS